MMTVYVLLAIPWILLPLGAMILWRRGRIDASGSGKGRHGGLSIVIPARNERENLPNLLADIEKQSLQAEEIIVIDDGSTDGTSSLVHIPRARCLVLNAEDKPEGWNGKSYACHRGVLEAKGDALLFLDADVRLGPDALGDLMQRTQTAPGAVHCVQPWHIPGTHRESLSAALNVLVLSGTGAFLPVPQNPTGAFGPCIWMSRETYHRMGGHEAIRGAGLENLAMGKRLVESGIPLMAYQGKRGICYRMYSGGWKEQNQGWVKSLVYGGESSGTGVTVLIASWIAGSLSAFGNLWLPFVYPVGFAWCAGGYLAWAALLAWQTSTAGKFPFWTWALYPIPMGYLLWVQFEALRRKRFKKPVLWRGRDLSQ